MGLPFSEWRGGRRLIPAAAAAAVCFLYFWRLDGVGILGPDEPRYASIAREMARSGDWITPRLWGEPWFEKPALLYWMVGAAFRAGLAGELAARVPVALAGLLFLALFHRVLAREFGFRAAAFSTAILATSAGWLAYGHVGVTDVPLAAAFSAAMLLAMRWLFHGERSRLPAAGALMGAAVLAKGLVPLVLALPLAWFGRRRLPDLLHPRAGVPFLLIALPWYAACYLRNGPAFLREFFWEHHFERVASGSLQHVQPAWFYVPMLLGLLFPWTPLLAGLLNRKLYHDPRCRFLVLWLAFGFVFFSIPVNKLPGYLLPLVPAAAALMGISLDRARAPGSLLAASMLLLTLVPPLLAVLPEALANGLSRSAPPRFAWYWAIPAALSPVAWLLERRGRRGIALSAVALGVAAGVVAIKAAAYPEIDRVSTVRPVWRSIEPLAGQVCVGDLHRSLRYGLNFYSVTPLPDCYREQRPLEVSGKASPRLTPRGDAL